MPQVNERNRRASLSKRRLSPRKKSDPIRIQRNRRYQFLPKPYPLVSDYLRLIHEVRRFIIPRLETAEGFQFNFEWRNQDYKQVLYTTKELMKNKRLQHMRSQKDERNSSSSPRPSDRKTTSSTASLHSMKSNNNSKSTAQFSFQNNQQNTTSTYSYSVSNPTEQCLTTEMLTMKSDIPAKVPSVYHSKSTVNDIRSTRANSNAHNEYNPANARVGFQGNTREDDSLNYDKPLESDRRHEDLGNLGENMGTTSSILPRTNTMMSAFNETFENLSIDDSKKPYPEHSTSNVPAKNYDYPLM